MTTAPNIDRPRTLIPPPAPFAAAITAGWWLDRDFIPLSLNLGAAALPMAGLAIAAGLSLMLWAVLTLVRHRTTFNPYSASASLCVAGPFRFSRNPIYLGDWLILAGAALWLQTWWPALFSPLVWSAVRYGVIRHEEAYLEARFGDDYRIYLTRVRRWL